MGLVLMLAAETGGAMAVLDQGFPDALYGSTKSLATVGPNTAVQKGPGWFKLAMVATMLLTLFSAACFTGGLIDASRPPVTVVGSTRCRGANT